MADPRSAFEAYVFSDSEKYFYYKVFQQVQKNLVAHGNEVAETMRKSNVPEEVLGKIWDLCDRSEKGYLTQIEFFVVMRGISIAQRGNLVSIDSISACQGIDCHDLPRLGPEYPLPTVEEIAKSKRNSEGAFEEDDPLVITKINPQFNVKISFPIKHEGIKEYMIYTIDVHCTMGILSSTAVIVHRRFSDFLWLRNCLVQDTLGHIIPPLPVKQFFGRFERQFLESRRKSLENFLNSVTADPQLLSNPHLVTFLQADDETFAKAKAKTKSFVQQLIEAIRNSLQVISVAGPIPVLTKTQEYSLDSRLEQFLKHLDDLRDNLKNCLVLHGKMINSENVRVKLLLEFILLTIPPISPLSLRELRLLQLNHSTELNNRIAAQTSDFRDILDHIVSQIASVKEVINQRKEIEILFESKEKKLEAKQQRSTAIQSDASKKNEYESLQKEISSLSKEKDSARHKLESVSQSLEIELQKFETTRKQQLMRALQSIAKTEKEFATFQTTQLQSLLQRIIEANSSKLAVPVNVPIPVLQEADLLWCREDQYEFRVRNIVSFELGQEAVSTILLPGELDKQADNVFAAPTLQTSFTLPSNQNSSSSSKYEIIPDSTLPSYAHASVSSPQFHKISDELDDETNIFLQKKEPTQASAVPAHWES